MRRLIYLIVAILIVAVAIVIVWVARNPSPQSAGHSNSTSLNIASGTINIRNMMFTPSQITVSKGGTVTWTNNDKTTHTVEDDLTNVGGPASGDIKPGKSYSFTFTKTGSFQYHDRLHTSMRGTIVVK